MGIAREVLLIEFHVIGLYQSGKRQHFQRIVRLDSLGPIGVHVVREGFVEQTLTEAQVTFSQVEFPSGQHLTRTHGSYNFLGLVGIDKHIAIGSIPREETVR